MTGSTTDNQLDQLVKARWLALGLSQQDLAEVLGGQADGTAKDGIDPGRLRQIAHALGLPAEHLEDRPGQGKAAPGTNDESLQSLLELRLLRLFRELRDYNTKCILIELTEQIVRRQGSTRGDAG